MKYLTSFLEQIKKSEHLGQGTPKTPKSTCGVTNTTFASVAATEETAAETAPEIADSTTTSGMGLVCDDCGRPTRIALVTSYGSRYCRECVFPNGTAPKARRDAQ
jgi:hypothetical protein